MEDEFKQRLMEKYAQDDKIEQMNAQKRRMKELEHKRDIEKLWQQKLAVFRVQRESELEEKRKQDENERKQLSIIEMEKERLLREHGNVLSQFHPKAAT